MPELPEVETIVNELQPQLAGRVFHDIEVFWPRSIIGKVEDFKRRIIGREITALNRRGKFICFQLNDGSHLTLHLRMTGKLVYCPGEKNHKHLRVSFFFSDNCPLFFIDLRKFGRLKVWPAHQPLLPDLGPEPMQWTTVYDTLRRLKSRRFIKPILLDQRVLAGLGNIYADESLFLAGIHPQTPLQKINPGPLKKLSQVIPRVLKSAVKNKGTTLSDFERPQNLPGKNQHRLWIYRRNGSPCLRCGTSIQKITISNRSSHFCPTCQK